MVVVVLSAIIFRNLELTVQAYVAAEGDTAILTHLTKPVVTGRDPAIPTVASGLRSIADYDRRTDDPKYTSDRDDRRETHSDPLLTDEARQNVLKEKSP